MKKKNKLVNDENKTPKETITKKNKKQKNRRMLPRRCKFT
jgi:hypothetical protein